MLSYIWLLFAENQANSASGTARVKHQVLFKLR